MDLRFKHPFTMIVGGPTSSGKSYFVIKLLKNGIRNISLDFKEILWCYSEWYPELPDLKNKIRFQKGLEDLEREDHTEPRLIVIDDLMKESNKGVVTLFTRGSHHTNTSVIFITQNIFHQARGQRDISLNAHYLVLLKNPRDVAQIAHLARQIYPSNPKFIQEAYRISTERPHGYLLIDLKQSTPEDCRIRTNIFGEQEPAYTLVFKPKNKKPQHDKK